MLTGLDPRHAGVTEARDGGEKEFGFGNVIRIEEDEQRVARGTDLAPHVFEVAGFGATAYDAGDAANAESPAHRFDVAAARRARDTAVIADHDLDARARVFGPVSAPRRERAMNGLAHDVDALVDCRDEDEDRTRGGILVVGRRVRFARPERVVEPEDVERGEHFGRIERHGQPRGLPVDHPGAPHEVVDDGSRHHRGEDGSLLFVARQLTTRDEPGPENARAENEQNAAMCPRHPDNGRCDQHDDREIGPP